MVEKRKILIAGAGIGGLAAAANLLSAGHDVHVYEQAPKLGEIGAGIQMSANAVKVLYHLGLKEALEKVVVKPNYYHFRIYNTKEILQTIPLNADGHHEKANGAPYYQIHRADIHSILVDAVQNLAPDSITLNATVVGFEEDERSATLKFADGTSVSGDIIIGAEGIKSAIRPSIVGENPPNWTGQVAWRALIPANRLPKGFLEKDVNVWCGPKNHCVVYYLRCGEIINFVGLLEHKNWTEEGWAIKCPWEELKADYEGWHSDIQTIIDAMDRDECYRWALNNREPVQLGWSTKRATLLGDSIHATLPYMAQGAVMAIEDGAVLRRSLDQCDDIAEALDLYQRNRYARTARIVSESTHHGAMFQKTTEAESRQAFQDKDVAKERAEWLYSYDPLTVKLV